MNIKENNKIKLSKEIISKINKKFTQEEIDLLNELIQYADINTNILKYNNDLINHENVIEIFNSYSSENIKLYLKKLYKNGILGTFQTGNIETEKLMTYYFINKGVIEKEIIIDTTISKSRDGYVYFIQAGNGSIKIGFSKDVNKRLKQLQTSSSEKLQLLMKLKGNTEDEKYLHNKFKEDNISGEWFKPSQNLITYIIKNISNN